MAYCHQKDEVSCGALVASPVSFSHIHQDRTLEKRKSFVWTSVGSTDPMPFVHFLALGFRVLLLNGCVGTLMLLGTYF